MKTKSWSWREWERRYALLPPVGDKTVLDLGCGVGDVARASSRSIGTKTFSRSLGREGTSVPADDSTHHPAASRMKR